MDPPSLKVEESLVSDAVMLSLECTLECTLDRDVGLHMMSRSTALIKLSNHFHDTSLQPRFESDRRATIRVCPL